jgi:hypothetical protein
MKLNNKVYHKETNTLYDIDEVYTTGDVTVVFTKDNKCFPLESVSFELDEQQTINTIKKSLIKKVASSIFTEEQKKIIRNNIIKELKNEKF